MMTMRRSVAPRSLAEAEMALIYDLDQKRSPGTQKISLWESIVSKANPNGTLDGRFANIVEDKASEFVGRLDKTVVEPLWEETEVGMEISAQGIELVEFEMRCDIKTELFQRVAGDAISEAKRKRTCKKRRKV